MWLILLDLLSIFIYWLAKPESYKVYIFGDGGARPKHAVLRAMDIDEHAYLNADRLLMFYVSRAKHCRRTAAWLEEPPCGNECLEKVVVANGWVVCEEMQAMIECNIPNSWCEWRERQKKPPRHHAVE